MELVHVSPKSFDDYMPFLDDDIAREIKSLAAELQGKKVAMINATSYGGGVAEKLHSIVPLLKDLGLLLDWWVFRGNLEFYQVTKAFHNCLQGREGELKSYDTEIFLEYTRRNAEHMSDWNYDIILVHDPQPVALIDYMKRAGGSKWAWRCHIDTSHPNAGYWDFIYRYVRLFDAVIFTMPGFVKDEAKLDNLTFIPPSIDPLSPKNVIMDKEQAKSIVCRFGVDTDRPLLTQVSRFDPWKDPLGVIQVYKMAKKEMPSVQLALVGSMASDDPEGWDYLYHTLRRAGEDYDIKVVTNFNGITNLEVNAFQTISNVILQKSLREGFGLTVAEAIWKGTPVVGGRVGGITLQIEDGVTGFLVDTVEECFDRCLTLLRNPAVAHEFAAAGKEKVRREFITTTNALHYLRLFQKLLSTG